MTDLETATRLRYWNNCIHWNKWKWLNNTIMYTWLP